MVEFEVSDDGPGIDPQYHARIFEMFQTLQPRDQTEGSGMGLGDRQEAGGKLRRDDHGRVDRRKRVDVPVYVAAVGGDEVEGTSAA